MKKYFTVNDNQPPHFIPLNSQPVTFHNNDKIYKKWGHTYIHHTADTWRLKKITKAVLMTFASLLLLPLASRSFRKTLGKTWKQGVFGNEKEFSCYKEVVKELNMAPSTSSKQETKKELLLKKEDHSISSSFDGLFKEIKNWNSDTEARFEKLCEKVDFTQLSIEELQKFFAMHNACQIFTPSCVNFNFTEEQMIACLKENHGVSEFSKNYIEDFLTKFNKDDLLFTYYANTLSNYVFTVHDSITLIPKLLKLAEGREDKADFLKYIFDEKSDPFFSLVTIKSDKLVNELLKFVFAGPSRYCKTYFLYFCKNKLRAVLSNEDQVLATYLEKVPHTDFAFFIKILKEKGRLSSIVSHFKSEHFPNLLPLLANYFESLTGVRTDKVLGEDLKQLLSQNKNLDHLPHVLSLFKDRTTLYSFLLEIKNEHQQALCFTSLQQAEQDEFLKLCASSVEAEKKLRTLIKGLNQAPDNNFLYWQAEFNKKHAHILTIFKFLREQKEMDLAPIYLEFIRNLFLHPFLFKNDHQNDLNSILKQLIDLLPKEAATTSLTILMRRANNEDMRILEILPLLKLDNLSDELFVKIVRRVNKNQIGYAFFQSSDSSRARLFEIFDKEKNEDFLQSIKTYLGEEKYNKVRHDANRLKITSNRGF